MAKKNNERLDELFKMLSEKTGLNIQWAGSNGEYCCVSISPFNYLQGYHTKRDTILYIEGVLAGLDFNARKYRMTLQQVCDRIAEFTGDKKKEAMRKAKIFRANCCAPLTEIKDFRLSFGRTEHKDGTTTENRDTLHFYYKDSDGDSHQFSILD